MKSFLTSLLAWTTPFGHTPIHRPSLIFQYPSGTWLENLAVRSDGSLLFTSLDCPGGLHSIRPLGANPKPSLIASFPSFNSTLGIVETMPDRYYLIAANFTLERGTQARSNAIFRVDFTDLSAAGDPKVEKVVDVTEAGELNGLTAFNETVLLAADSYLGAVWAIDLRSGSVSLVTQDPLMAPAGKSEFKLGINGLHFRERTLYFTNTQQALLAKVELDHNVRPTGSATVVAHATREDGVKTSWDDFTISPSGDIFVATPGGNAIQLVTQDGHVQTLAGSVNSTVIAQPTSVKLGRGRRDRGVLYMTTAGGEGEPVYQGDEGVMVGGQIVAIDLRGHGWAGEEIA